MADTVLPAAVPANLPGLPPSAPVQAALPQAAPAVASDPFAALMAQAAAAPPPSAPQAAAPAPDATPTPVASDPFSALMAQAAQAPVTATPAATPTPTPAAPAKPSVPLKASDYAGAAVEPILTGITAAIAQPIGGAARLASAALGNTFQGAQDVGNKLSDMLTYHPQTQGGQMALAGIENAAGKAGSAVMASPLGDSLRQMGDSYNKTFVQGAPNALMATINSQVPTVIANAAAGPVLGKVGDVAGAATNKLADLAASRAPAVNPLADAARVEPTLTPTPAATPATPDVKPNYRPNGDGTFTQTAPAQAAPATPGPAPAAAAPQPTPSFEVPDVPTPKTSLAEPEQQANIAAMNAIGLDSQRPSAIAGDKFMAGTEYQQAKLDTPQGEVMRAQLGTEQNAIKSFAQGIVQDTGAAADAAPEAVGQAIRAPLQGLSDNYDNAISGLYQEADQRAAGAPSVELNALPKLLADPDFRETLMAKNQQGLLDSVGRQLERFQGTAADGSGVAPNTVASAEKFRQWMNSIWSPDNSAPIGRMKEALDTDVMKSAGEDTYAASRALHAERKNTLDNPNGIASLLNQDGPGGINQTVPDEKVAPKMLTMPTNQFAHVVDTLKSLPDTLAPQGQQAIAEVKGALAKKIYTAGDSGGTQNGGSLWNAANVTKALNANASKMALVFTPEEIAQFQTLNRAGHILQTPSAYPGAAVQGHNLVQKGLIHAPAAVGAYLGSHVGGWEGATVGAAAGNALSRRLATAADQKVANKLQQVLKNPQVIRAK